LHPTKAVLSRRGVRLTCRSQNMKRSWEAVGVERILRRVADDPKTSEARQDRPGECLGDDTWACADGLRQREVVLRVGSILLLGCEFRLSDRRHKTPVPTHRAPLESHPTEADRLERGPWDPQRGEQMAASATDDELAADWVAPCSHRDGFCQHTADEQESAPTP